MPSFLRRDDESLTMRSAIDADKAGRRLSNGFAWTPTLCFFDCVGGAPRPGFRSPLSLFNRSSFSARALFLPNKVGAFSFILGISMSKWPVTCVKIKFRAPHAIDATLPP